MCGGNGRWLPDDGRDFVTIYEVRQRLTHLWLAQWILLVIDPDTARAGILERTGSRRRVSLLRLLNLRPLNVMGVINCVADKILIVRVCRSRCVTINDVLGFREAFGFIPVVFIALPDEHLQVREH